MALKIAVMLLNILKRNIKIVIIFHNITIVVLYQINADLGSLVS